MCFDSKEPDQPVQCDGLARVTIAVELAIQIYLIVEFVQNQHARLKHLTRLNFIYVACNFHGISCES